jgi:hypothetical protein
MPSRSSREQADALREQLGQKQDLNIAEVAQVAASDPVLVAELLDGLEAKNDVYRYNCFQVLTYLSEQQPKMLVPAWDRLVQLLDSDNAYHRSCAVNLLANLVRADPEDRFAGIFDQYVGLLDDEKVMVARYLARNMGKIALARPNLQSKIVDRLIAIDQAHHTQGRKDLIKSDIIGSFEEFYEESQDKARIRTFVEEQLDCSSPKTRQAAKRFLKVHG